MITKYSEYIKENVSSNQFFKTYEETKEWLDRMYIKEHNINLDLTVDVNKYVILSNYQLTKIPVQFGIVKGNFYCEDNKLNTLIGTPKEVYMKYFMKIIN